MSQRRLSVDAALYTLSAHQSADLAPFRRATRPPDTIARDPTNSHDLSRARQAARGGLARTKKRFLLGDQGTGGDKAVQASTQDQRRATTCS